MGPHRPCPHVLPRRGLLRPVLVLHHRRHYPCHHLLRHQALAKISSSLAHGPSHLRRLWCHSPCYAAQLPLIGCRRLRLPVLDQASLVRLVEPPELHDLQWPRPWARSGDLVHLLRLYYAGNRGAKLVGKRHRGHNNGRARNSSSRAC